VMVWVIHRAITLPIEGRCLEFLNAGVENWIRSLLSFLRVKLL
jgi:hypothetical protein